VKDNVLDLLIYLFENYMSADDEPRPDRAVLKLELDKAGFAEPDIDRALEWLDGLSGEQLGKVAEATARAVRVFSGQELLRLDTDVRANTLRHSARTRDRPPHGARGRRDRH
jgi:Smg protein